jgi:hypothetical protein
MANYKTREEIWMKEKKSKVNAPESKGSRSCSGGGGRTNQMRKVEETKNLYAKFVQKEISKQISKKKCSRLTATTL